CAEAQAGGREAWAVERVDPTGLSGAAVRHVLLPLQVSPPRTGRARAPDQGDLPNARALWLSARSRAAVPRGLADQPQEDLSGLSRDGPATAQQDAQASRQGEAAGRPITLLRSDGAPSSPSRPNPETLTPGDPRFGSGALEKQLHIGLAQ